jgi:hypothetical protein
MPIRASLANRRRHLPTFEQGIHNYVYGAPGVNIPPGPHPWGSPGPFDPYRPRRPTAPVGTTQGKPGISRPASAAPAPTGPTGDPLLSDPDYIATVGLADRNLADTLGEIGRQETGATTEYGLDASGNAQTDAGGQYLNPFSRAALLKQHFDQAKNAVTSGSAAQGQLYSGSAQSQQMATRGAYDQGYHGLQSSLADLLGQLAFRRTQARTAHDTAQINALAAARDRALGQPPDAVDPVVAAVAAGNTVDVSQPQGGVVTYGQPRTATGMTRRPTARRGRSRTFGYFAPPGSY